ncbi:MAG: hypothetical protein IJ537_09290 [Bacteroidaceae bacterium]|nr:hypothetical protein [Bacteroidaceae bacterium]
MNTKKLIMLLAAVLLGSVSAFAQSGNNEPLKGDVNGDGVVDVADIAAIIAIIKNNTAPQTTYYWYAGQTNPLSMTTISPIVTSYENGGGWYELGTTLPTSIDQLIKGGTAGNIWYVAVPADANLVPGSSADPDTSVTTGSTKVFNNVTYQIYIYEGVTGTRGSFELNR